MIRSMTGFGKATSEADGDALSVEVSSVNHRYLDCSIRLPYAWAAIEPVLKQVVRDLVARGKLNCTVNRKRTGSPVERVLFDENTARQYVEASKKLGQLLGNNQTVSLDVLAQMEGVFYQEEEEEDLDVVKDRVIPVLTAAIERLNMMRLGEGAALAQDIRHRIELLREALSEIETRLPSLNKRYETKLRTRINELKTETAITEERIAIEVAMLAEKGDVTEEVVRLKAHLDHMVELLESKEPVGRRLDFLSQEVQREVNTLGVKTRDGDVVTFVLTMKSELERIREQVQNIE